ncbi:pol [Symbiodinium sp. CCMP2592]|nr:pol [Symbiodinium sp. CCMP2592]
MLKILIAMLINTLSSAARKKNLNALYGKTADLKGAYRQLVVSDTSLDFSYLAVYDPAEEKPKLFQQLAVPFGSTKAVYFFLRVARALWTILVKGAKIPTTNYFDDFVLLALGGDRNSCSHAFDEVMKLLGWKLSADKTTEWNTSFEALGVLFELDQTGSGVLKVRNTEKRRKELTAAIKGFLDKGTMTQKEALQLRGRLQFAQAQFFGRLGRRCLTEVTKHAYTGRSKLSPMAKERLEEFGKFLDMAQPRLVGQVSCRTFMILTDAAFETESGTGGLGGVLLTGSGSALSFFSVPISEQQAKSMSLQDEHTIIYELEMFGVLIGLKLLVEKTAAFAESYEQPGAVAGTGVICYIDNDAARHAYIAGSSKKGVAGILIDEVNFLEYVHGDQSGVIDCEESFAVFLSKCTQLGLPEDARGKLKRKGWATFGTFAFCVPGEPGRIPDDVFKTSVVQPILGDGGEEHQAKLRRLHFEAYALTAAELKRTAESTESDQPRKVPTAELAARYDVLQRRVKPLRLVDRLEPSHSLVNLSAQMLEDQRVRYIEWSKCTSRAQEINLVKEDASLKLLQGGRSGSVKLVDPGSKITADTKSDLEVMQALRRRGVAYELAAIMSFEKHEELIDRLFMEYQREPMPGFHPISFAQLQAADREVHVRMGELTRAGLVSGADGSLPLDGPVSQVLAGSHIQWMLMPRQKGSGPLGSSGAGEANEKPDKPPRKPPKKTDPSKATDKDQGADKNQKADSGASPNAAERPGKQRKTRFVMPKALIGQVQSATNVHDTANSHLGNDRDTNAEIFAATLIGKVDAGGIRRLLELLPSEVLTLMIMASGMVFANIAIRDSCFLAGSPSIMTRAANTATVEQVKKMLNANYKKLGSQYTESHPAKVACAYEAFILDYLNVSSRPVKTVISKAACLAFEGLEQAEADHFGRQIANVVQFARLKRKSISSGKRTDPAVLRIVEALSRREAREEQAKMGIAPPKPKLWRGRKTLTKGNSDPKPPLPVEPRESEPDGERRPRRSTSSSSDIYARYGLSVPRAPIGHATAIDVISSSGDEAFAVEEDDHSPADAKTVSKAKSHSSTAGPSSKAKRMKLSSGEASKPSNPGTSQASHEARLDQPLKQPIFTYTDQHACKSRTILADGSEISTDLPEGAVPKTVIEHHNALASAAAMKKPASSPAAPAAPGDDPAVVPAADDDPLHQVRITTTMTNPRVYITGCRCKSGKHKRELLLEIRQRNFANYKDLGQEYLKKIQDGSLTYGQARALRSELHAE